jgi:hypothetical protein
VRALRVPPGDLTAVPCVTLPAGGVAPGRAGRAAPVDGAEGVEREAPVDGAEGVEREARVGGAEGFERAAPVAGRVRGTPGRCAGSGRRG